jgi:mycothiol synthase
MDDAIDDIDRTSVPGLAFRHFRGDPDLPGILAVIHAAHHRDGVDAFPSLERLANELDHPVNENAASDLIVGELDARIVAYARASWSVRNGTYVYQSDGEVHPDVRRRGIGRALLRAEHGRLRRIAADHPTGAPRHLQAWLFDGQGGRAALLSSEGYAPVRYFTEMARSLAEPIPTVALPNGLEIRPVVPADHRRIFDAEAEAFRDHWGYREWTDADFARTFDDPDLDTSLWRVGWAGDAVAGVVVTLVPQTENAELGTLRGWLDRISVRRPWRRRGLAAALIASAFEGLRERGLDTAMLGVDAENPTGALALYERLGFRRVSGGQVLTRPLDDAEASGP